MSRTAEYSIKGYVYQFLKHLSAILAAEGSDRITIEGAIEDIDVTTARYTTAIQCKYHERAEKYTLGKIYKPILLMLEHFCSNPTTVPPVHYRLFCHFPDKFGEENLSKTELQLILATTATNLEKIVKRLPPSVDFEIFLSRLKIEFGPTVEELQKHVLTGMSSAGFNRDDVEAIIYPAAFQRIVEISTRGTIQERTVAPGEFLASLREVRHVTFTRWTRELATRKQIFERLRKELKIGLDFNARRRFFIIDPTLIAGFDADIVNFIKAFVDKYSFKYLHSDPPLFAITDSYDIGALQVRLHDRGLIATNGLVGANEFRISHLLRSPMIKRQQPVQFEFALRLAQVNQLVDLERHKPSELFLINQNPTAWPLQDVKIHAFDIERLSDLEYALRLKDSYV